MAGKKTLTSSGSDGGFSVENAAFYSELFSRNWPIITKDQQSEIARLRVAVAGCGSTGGAFIDGTLRLGVNHFRLADSGEYELNNLNRQMVEISDVGKNKALAHSQRIKRINETAQVSVFADGITPHNVDAFLEHCDLVFDAVDVTTTTGMKMKLLLHEKAWERRLPVASALDLGFTQWLQSFDYSQGRPCLDGRLEEAKKCAHPLKALIGPFCPVEQLPLEITEELIRLFQDPHGSACQLGSVCFLLAGMVTPYVLYFIEHGKLPPLIQIDLLAPFHTNEEMERRVSLTRKSHQALRAILEKTE